MTTKTKIIVAVVALAASFAGGYYLAPVKVKTETKIVEVEKKSKTTSSNKNKKKITVKITRPDGTKEETTTVETGESKNSSSTQESNKSEESKKEVTKSSSRLNISALAGAQVNLGIPVTATPVFGAHISKDIIGPVSIGVWGLSDVTFGVSVGLTF